MDQPVVLPVVKLGDKEVPEEVRKWIVSTFSRQEQDEKERKSKFFTF